jgi:CBS domain-containing protein
MPTLEKLLSGRALLALPGSASALDAARAMTSEKIGSVLIVDAERRPVGIFTERDLMARVVVPGLDASRTRLDTVMTRELLLGHLDDAIETARRALQNHHIRHLPIVGPDGRALAMVGLRDLLRFDLAEREHECEALHEYIAGSDAPAEGPSQRPSSF